MAKGQTISKANYGTLPAGEILSGKNAQAFLVCGFLMYPENMKKIVGAVWKLPA